MLHHHPDKGITTTNAVRRFGRACLFDELISTIVSGEFVEVYGDELVSDVLDQLESGKRGMADFARFGIGVAGW